MAKLHLNLKKILVDKCNVLEVTQTPDAAGQLSNGVNTTTPLAADQRCRLIPMGRKLKENTTETRLSESYFNVFMMPPGFQLTEHHWLQIWQFIGNTWIGGELYNIVDAPPQLMEGAPVELVVKQVRA